MWQTVLNLCLLIVGIVHLLPGIGMLGERHLVSLYGVDIVSRDVLLLMRHRAVLFVILGGIMLASIRIPQLQWTAILAGLASVLSFVWLCSSPAGYTEEIAKVFYIDIVAGAFLVLAMLGKWRASL